MVLATVAVSSTLLHPAILRALSLSACWLRQMKKRTICMTVFNNTGRRAIFMSDSPPVVRQYDNHDAFLYIYDLADEQTSLLAARPLHLRCIDHSVEQENAIAVFKQLSHRYLSIALQLVALTKRGSAQEK